MEQGIRYNEGKWQVHKGSPLEIIQTFYQGTTSQPCTQLAVATQEWRDAPESNHHYWHIHQDLPALCHLYWSTETLIKENMDGPLTEHKWVARPDLLPSDVILKLNHFDAEILEDASRVYSMGAEKYSERNWELGLAWDSGVMSSFVRHLWEYGQGIEIDKESELPHLYHMVFNILALMAYTIREVGYDDRKSWKKQ